MFIYGLMFIFLLASSALKSAEDSKAYWGLDKDGLKRACHPLAPDEVICTLEYTEGDAFADDCRLKGGQVIQCGCHDYLCLSIVEKQSNILLLVFGHFHD
jgi:hypothetical protein